jgi:hypothetical protein
MGHVVTTETGSRVNRIPPAFTMQVIVVERTDLVRIFRNRGPLCINASRRRPRRKGGFIAGRRSGIEDSALQKYHPLPPFLVIYNSGHALYNILCAGISDTFFDTFTLGADGFTEGWSISPKIPRGAWFFPSMSLRSVGAMEGWVALACVFSNLLALRYLSSGVLRDEQG